MNSQHQKVAQLLRLKEAEQVSGLSRSYLYEAMAQGQLPYYKLGRARRIGISDLMDYLSARRVEARGK